MNHVIRTMADKIEIELKGKLTFLDHTRFQHITEVLDDEVRLCVMNLTDLDFIDSAGLGMLLLMRDKAFEKNANVALKGACGQVKKMIELGQFDTLFLIET
jgi:anti-anti-sigma factor